ncbi:nuclear receptor subfamily 5 group a member 2 [Plakobranchus ocellatus]|uniref:Nuclear receptor subfamily 5 group a member 2 n=1 Tax=Plakobranchus ocellatus TaxID=259542 RepID=A0AAV3ZES3_9GAST|nr:nuclear receptor subfamily 5 group a member 2 [Plakobranchus ocellatus]
MDSWKSTRKIQESPHRPMEETLIPGSRHPLACVNASSTRLGQVTGLKGSNHSHTGSGSDRAQPIANAQHFLVIDKIRRLISGH